MPRRLNWDEPYAFVSGMPGVVYEQDWAYFDLAGNFVSEDPGRPKDEPKRRRRGEVDAGVAAIYGDDAA